MADLIRSEATQVADGSNDLEVTDSEQDLVAAMASGHAAEVDCVVVTNISASVDVVTVKRYIGATGTEICFEMEVPVGGPIVVVSKNNVYRLNEGDKITVVGGAASGALKASANWVEFS